MAVLSVTTLCLVVSTRASVLSLFVRSEKTKWNENPAKSSKSPKLLVWRLCKDEGNGKEGERQEEEVHFMQLRLCSVIQHTCLFSQCHKSSFCLHQMERILSQSFHRKNAIWSYSVVCLYSCLSLLKLNNMHDDYQVKKTWNLVSGNF